MSYEFICQHHSNALSRADGTSPWISLLDQTHLQWGLANGSLALALASFQS